MDDQVKLLVALQDLDQLIKESRDDDTSSALKEMGFKLDGIAKLQESRDALAKRIKPQLLNRYERVSRSLERAIVPVTDNFCLGCFVTLPTSYSSLQSKSQILTCENCGRILYFL